jgi:hypothetical protein
MVCRAGLIQSRGFPAQRFFVAGDRNNECHRSAAPCFRDCSAATSKAYSVLLPSTAELISPCWFGAFQVKGHP